jgi:hypothetical protein
MSKLLAARGSQNVQEAEFVASFSDTMVEVGGVLKDMLAITTGDVFKAIQLPPNAEIVGGEVQVEVQGVGPTAYTVEVGTSSDGTAANFSNTLLGATSLLTAIGTRTALVLTSATVNPGLQSANPNDLFIRLIRSVAVATAGKFVLRVMFIQRGKVDEAVPS